jgi:hypothetical protein
MMMDLDSTSAVVVSKEFFSIRNHSHYESNHHNNIINLTTSRNSSNVKTISSSSSKCKKDHMRKSIVERLEESRAKRRIEYLKARETRIERFGKILPPNKSNLYKMEKPNDISEMVLKTASTTCPPLAIRDPPYLERVHLIQRKMFKVTISIVPYLLVVLLSLLPLLYSFMNDI